MWRSVTQYHETIGYTFVPGIRSRVSHEGGGYLIKTNQGGFRCDHEFEARRSPGTFRVLLFGDSQTAGDGVSNGERFSDVLETLIPKTQIFNFGLPGSGTDQQYLAWQTFGARIDHDLLLLAVHVENIGRVNARFRPYTDENGHEIIYAKPYYTLQEGALKLNQVPVPRAPLKREDMAADDLAAIDGGVRFPALRKLAKSLGVRDLLARVSGINPVPDFDRADNPRWVLMSMILEEWIKASKTPVLIVPIPLFTFVEEMSDPRAYQERFHELAAKTACVVHDPLPDLTRHDMQIRRSFRFKTDVHYTRAGHRALAESLAPPIRKMVQG